MYTYCLCYWLGDKERGARFGTKCGEIFAGWFVVTTRGRLAFSGDLFLSRFPCSSLNISRIFHSFYMIPHLSPTDVVVVVLRSGQDT